MIPFFPTKKAQFTQEFPLDKNMLIESSFQIFWHDIRDRVNDIKILTGAYRKEVTV